MNKYAIKCITQDGRERWLAWDSSSGGWDTLTNVEYQSVFPIRVFDCIADAAEYFILYNPSSVTRLDIAKWSVEDVEPIYAITGWKPV